MGAKCVRWGIVGALCALAGAVSADKAKEQQSSVAVTQQHQEKEVQLHFKVRVEKGLYLNHEAPWSLHLDELKGITIAKIKMDKKDFDKKLGQFSVKATRTAAKAGELRYKLVAFTCTADQQRCYREVHQGKVKVEK